MSYHHLVLKKNTFLPKQHRPEKACFEMVLMKTASGLS